MRRMYPLEEILKLGSQVFVTVNNNSQQIGENKAFKNKVGVNGRNYKLIINENYFTLTDGSRTHTIQIPFKSGILKLDQDDSRTITGSVNISSGTTNIPLTLNEDTIKGLHSIIKQSLLNIKPLPDIELWLYVYNGSSEVYHTIIRLESYTYTTGEYPFDYRTFYLRFVSTRPVENYHEYIQITITDDTHASGIYSRINL